MDNSFMTIEQAMITWNKKEKSMLKLLTECRIRGIKVDNGKILIPKKFSLIYDIPQNAKYSEENCYKYILLALLDCMYIDNTVLFGISRDDYAAYLNNLESSGYIRKKDRNKQDDDITGYMLTPNLGINKAKEIKNKKGKGLINEFNMINGTQIGLINVRL